MGPATQSRVLPPMPPMPPLRPRPPRTADMRDVPCYEYGLMDKSPAFIAFAETRSAMRIYARPGQATRLADALREQGLCMAGGIPIPENAQVFMHCDHNWVIAEDHATALANLPACKAPAPKSIAATKAAPVSTNPATKAAAPKTAPVTKAAPASLATASCAKRNIQGAGEGQQSKKQRLSVTANELARKPPAQGRGKAAQRQQEDEPEKQDLYRMSKGLRDLIQEQQQLRANKQEKKIKRENTAQADSNANKENMPLKTERSV